MTVVSCTTHGASASNGSPPVPRSCGRATRGVGGGRAERSGEGDSGGIDACSCSPRGFSFSLDGPPFNGRGVTSCYRRSRAERLVFDAVVDASKHWMIDRRTIRDRFADRTDAVTIFERGPVVDGHWDGEAFLRFADVLTPLPESLHNDLTLIGAATWSLDYTATVLPSDRERISDFRKMLFSPLPPRPDVREGQFAWIAVDPGEVRIGSEHGSPLERPEHDVRISSPFEITAGEITSRQFSLLLPIEEISKGGDGIGPMPTLPGSAAVCRPQQSGSMLPAPAVHICTATAPASAPHSVRSAGTGRTRIAHSSRGCGSNPILGDSTMSSEMPGSGRPIGSPTTRPSRRRIRGVPPRARPG